MGANSNLGSNVVLIGENKIEDTGSERKKNVRCDVTFCLETPRLL